MKIYEIGTGYTPIPAQMGAATEIVVEELTRAFLKNGEDVEIIDIKAEQRAANSLPISEVNVPSFFTKTDVSLGIMHKLKRVVYSISLAAKLKKILKTTDENVLLHFHNQYNLYFFLKLVPKSTRKRAIIAYTNHSYIWHGEWEEIKDSVKNRYFQEVFAMKHADLVFVLNENTKTNIINNCNIDAKKVVLIPNGVNSKTYKPLTAEEKMSCKASFSLNTEKVFIQVGSVCDRKNQLGSIELLLPLMVENKNVSFAFAGGIIDDDYFQKVIQFAKDNHLEDRIVYVGELCPGEKLNSFYNTADAMIFSSKSEGFSLTIIEALAAGVPVIISDSLTFEASDLCFKYNDTDSFINIVNIVNDINSHAELSESARRSVIDRYSWTAVAKKYSDCFNRSKNG